MTEDLTTWLRAQLDEDERGALNCIEHHWRPDGAKSCQVYAQRPDGSNRTIAWCANGYDDDFANSLHAANWDPARVLAEVEAKRRILDLHPHQRFPQPLDANSTFEDDRRAAFTEDPRYVGCQRCNWDWRFEEVYPSWWCDTVRLLASPYVDREGYRKEWAVTRTAEGDHAATPPHSAG